jgi:hypothetical protein
MVWDAETEEPLSFASADEATKTIEASDNVSASIFFTTFPFLEKKIARHTPGDINLNASGGRA